MSINNLDTPGARLRHVRTNILRITQDEMSSKLGVTRSLIPMMEKGKQGVSKATAEKIASLWGVDMAWLLMGTGPPPGIYAQDESNRGHDVIKEGLKSYRMSKPARRLLVDPVLYRDLGEPGRFGYVQLVGTKVRFHAVKDAGIAGTQLLHIVEDDRVWFIAGEPNGWEFEVLREYFEFGKDRSLPEWMECLRLIRWQRMTLIEGLADEDSEHLDAKSA